MKNFKRYFTNNYFIIIITLFIVIYLLNTYGYIKIYQFNGDVNSALSVLNSISQILGSILAINFSITILILEQISQQHSIKIFDLFLKKKINNFGPYIYLIINVVLSLYTSSLLRSCAFKLPITLLNINFFYAISSIIMIFFYFLHVIDFVRPESLLNMIINSAMKELGE